MSPPPSRPPAPTTVGVPLSLARWVPRTRDATHLRSFSVNGTSPKTPRFGTTESIDALSLVLHAAHDGHTGRSSEFGFNAYQAASVGALSSGRADQVAAQRRGYEARAEIPHADASNGVSIALLGADPYFSRGDEPLPQELFSGVISVRSTQEDASARSRSRRALAGVATNATFSFNATLPVIGGGACNRTSGFSSFRRGGDGDADCG